MIVILHSSIANDAPLDEHDTLLQVAVVREALQKLGLEVVAIPFTLDFAALKSTLQQYNPTVVFNLVESVNGRGELTHLVPSILEQLKIPYTGGSAKALFTSADKILAKRLLQSAAIPTPAWFELSDLKTKKFPSDGPYIIKSVIEDGSIGIDQTSFVRDQDAFVKIMQDRQCQFGGQWFAEHYIPGREFNISVLASSSGPQVLPIAEIKFIDFAADKFHIVDYAAKWETESNEYQKTPRSFSFSENDDFLLAHLKELSLTCWDLFAVSGYARVDFRVDHLDQPWVLEVNVCPSLAPDAGFIAAAKESGLAFEDVIERILQDARR